MGRGLFPLRGSPNVDSRLEGTDASIKSRRSRTTLNSLICKVESQVVGGVFVAALYLGVCLRGSCTRVAHGGGVYDGGGGEWIGANNQI